MDPWAKVRIRTKNQGAVGYIGPLKATVWSPGNGLL